MYARGEEGIEAMRTGQEMQKSMSGAVGRFFTHRVFGEDGKVHEFPCLEITCPGDLKSVSIRKVTALEQQMFPEAWESFKNGTEAALDGTSLDMFLGKDHPALRELNYHKLHTVEQVAGISDTVVQSLGMGFRDLRDQCAQYVERQNGNDVLAEQNKAMADQMAKMQEQLDRLAPKLAVDKEPEDVTASTATEDAPEGGSFDLAGALAGGNGLEVKRGFQCFKVMDGETELFSAPTKEQCDTWLDSQTSPT